MKTITQKNRITIALTLAFFLLIQFSFSQEKPKSISSDFDFLIGNWKVHNKKLKERLNNSNEWIEFDATTKTTKMMSGMVIIDEFFYTANNTSHTGMTYRIYNSKTGEWSIYWASTAYPELGLLPQVKGRFVDNVGTFYGEELHKGKMVKLRFTMTKIDKYTVDWNQAYLDPKTNEWEINWIMKITRQ